MEGLFKRGYTGRNCPDCGKVLQLVPCAGAPLGVLEDLSVEQAKEQVEKVISLSHSELITKENLKNETLDIFRPAKQNTFLVYYVLFTFIGLLVVYFYRRKVQNIDDQVNRQLDGMC